MFDQNASQRVISEEGLDPPVTADPPKKPTSMRECICLTCALLGIVLFVSLEWELVSQWLLQLLTWISMAGPLGAFVLTLTIMLGIVLFIPAIVLTLAAGYIYTELYGPGLGLIVGIAVVFVGATGGCILAMLIGRYVCQRWLLEKISRRPKLNALAQAVELKGVKIIILLRLCPLIPLNLFNYVMGATPVKFKDYLLGCVGMLPGVVAFVYFGSVLCSITEASQGEFEGGVLELVILILGAVAAVGAIAYLTFVAKKQIRSIVPN